MRHCFPATTAVWIIVSAAAAQVSPTGPFTGPYTEGFETTTALPNLLYPCLPDRLFNNTADLCDPTTSSIAATTFFSLFCSVTARTGKRFALGIQGPVEISFDAPVSK